MSTYKERRTKETRSLAYSEKSTRNQSRKMPLKKMLAVKMKIKNKRLRQRT